MGLKVENLRLEQVTEDDSHQLLVDELTFTLHRGETLALCGPSGCGKTSVARAILDLLPRGIKQTAGKITIEEDVRHPSWRGHRVGLIFQEPRLAFHPVFTIGRQVAERLQLAGVTKDRIRAESIKWLERIGIARPEQRLEHRASEFSGGELQRIMISMILAQKPEFLIADEPTSNLDVLVQGSILGLLKELQGDFNLGILLITHDQRVARAMTDQVISMIPITERRSV